MNFEERVLETIREYGMLPDGGRILVGISGGADSVCLLAVLERLCRSGRLPGVQLRAVHVHHGLRASADADESCVRALCGQLDIPLSVHHVDAAAEAARRGVSVEEGGRILRREIFREECRAWEAQASVMGQGSACCTALAHHMEDSAETLLFNLCRGSSVAGMAGIRPVSRMEADGPYVGTVLQDTDEPYAGTGVQGTDEPYAGTGIQGTDDPGAGAGLHGADGHSGCGSAKEGPGGRIRLIRPLIRTSRREIEEWLVQQGLPWCTDETNADIRYTRNYLRREILPALETNVHAGALRHMSRTALDLAEAEEYLREETQRRLSQCRTAAGTYSAEELKGMPLWWRRRVLYRAMTEMVPARDLGDVHVDALLRLLETTGSAQMDLPYGMTARKEYDVLTLERSGADRNPQRNAAQNASSAALPLSSDACRMRILPLSSDAYRMRILPYHGDMEIPDGPCTKWIDYDKITQSLSFRTRRDGDVIALGPSENGVPRYKRLSRVMIDRKIPASERDRIILPMDGRNVIWMPGYRIGADYRITETTRTVLELQLGPEDAGLEPADDPGGRGR